VGDLISPRRKAERLALVFFKVTGRAMRPEDVAAMERDLEEAAEPSAWKNSAEPNDFGYGIRAKPVQREPGSQAWRQTATCSAEPPVRGP
jgi:hypothetical protein